MRDVVRLVRWFEKDPGRNLISEAILPDATLAELQALFDVPPGDPMYDCWAVGPAQAAAIAAWAGFPLDLDRYDDLIEADAAHEG